MEEKDQVYNRPLAQIADFRFDEQVARVFPDMIERSVPGYRAIITMIETLTRRYAQPGTRLYDLGCSLGASTESMLRGLEDTDALVVSVDNSSAMIDRFRSRFADELRNGRVRVRQEDLLETPVENASVVVLNFTLQFIPRERRAELLDRIATGMRSGGVLILSEKIRFQDDHLQELMTDIHHEFKRANGYSDLEISQKRSALEQVLLPESISTHRSRLLAAGFSSCDVWFQCFNFMSMLAVK